MSTGKRFPRKIHPIPDKFIEAFPSPERRRVAKTDVKTRSCSRKKFAGFAKLEINPPDDDNNDGIFDENLPSPPPFRQAQGSFNEHVVEWTPSTSTKQTQLDALQLSPQNSAKRPSNPQVLSLLQTQQTRRGSEEVVMDFLVEEQVETTTKKSPVSGLVGFLQKRIFVVNFFRRRRRIRISSPDFTRS